MVSNKQRWRRTYKWRKVRKQVVKRDKCCVICGETRKLEVHHIEDASYHPEKRYDKANLETLCYWCHRPMYHILFKGGTRRKTTTKDTRKFKAIAKYYIRRGREKERTLRNLHQK